MFPSIRIPRGWVFDTNTKLTATSAGLIRLSPSWGQLGGSVPIGPIRYLSLGSPQPGDISPAERDAIFSVGFSALMLVQHVNWPNWQANNVLGTVHGKAAKAHADLIDEGAGECHLMVDIEGLGNAGAAAYDYIAYWSDAVRPHPTIVYDGYDDGLAPQWKQQLVTRGCVDSGAWWPDFAPDRMNPPPAGLHVAMRQKTQRNMGGVLVDPNEVLLDGYLIGIGGRP